MTKAAFRNGGDCLHTCHDLATKCVSVMVCVGRKDKLDALDRGAHGGGRSFFFITNGIAEPAALLHNVVEGVLMLQS
ncbi:hypothetical protein NP569_24990, partial [Vibrio parahaemolyticus]|nr:hypothetical protein [Vibrio parahaemolyticus]